MSTNIPFHARYRSIINCCVVAFSMFMSLTSCSTLKLSERAVNPKPSGAVLTTNYSAVEVMAPKNKGVYSPKVDKTMDDWEKARATYLRTLDYALISQQNNDHAEYLLKSNLIESRYAIRNAETALYVEHDYKKAFEELREANRHFNEAIKMANADELKDLEATKVKVDYLLKQTKLSADNGCVYLQSKFYDRTEAKIEDLVVNL